MSEPPLLRIELEVTSDGDVLRYMNAVLASSLPKEHITRELLKKGVPLYHPTSGQRVGTARLVTR